MSSVLQLLFGVATHLPELAGKQFDEVIDGGASRGPDFFDGRGGVLGRLIDFTLVAQPFCLRGESGDDPIHLALGRGGDYGDLIAGVLGGVVRRCGYRSTEEGRGRGQQAQDQPPP
ncbi:MAG: hypothetical protein ACRDWS_15445 [Acidimicrobiia bacterium]